MKREYLIQGILVVFLIFILLMLVSCASAQGVRWSDRYDYEESLTDEHVLIFETPGIQNWTRWATLADLEAYLNLQVGGGGLDVEELQDEVAAFLEAGTGIGLVYSDLAGSLEVSVVPNQLLLSSLGGSLGLAQISASGVRNSSTFLRGDGQWAVPTGGLSNITGLIQAGTNITLTGSGTSGSPYVINASGGGSSIVNLDDLDDVQIGGLVPSSMLFLDGSGVWKNFRQNTIPLSGFMGTLPVSRLETTGIATATTFLRGDGQWAVPAGGGGGATSISELSDGDRVDALENKALWPILVQNGDYTYTNPTDGHVRLYFNTSGTLTLPEPSIVGASSTEGNTIFVLATNEVTVDVAKTTSAALIGSCVLEAAGEYMTIAPEDNSTWRILGCDKVNTGGGGSWDGGTVSNPVSINNDLTVSGTTVLDETIVGGGLNVSAGTVAIPGYSNVATTLGTIATKASQTALQDTAAAIRADFPASGGGGSFDATGVPDGYLLGVENETVVALEVENIPSVTGQTGKVLSNDGTDLEWVAASGGTGGALYIEQGGDASLGNVNIGTLSVNESYRGPGAFRGVIASGDLASQLGDGEWAKVAAVDSFAVRDGAAIYKWPSQLHGEAADNTAPVVDSLYVAQVGSDVVIKIDADEEAGMILLESTAPVGSPAIELYAEDFTAVENAGVWTHTATQVDAGLGFWEYELTYFADAANNSSTVGQTDTLTVVENVGPEPLYADDFTGTDGTAPDGLGWSSLNADQDYVIYGNAAVMGAVDAAPTYLVATSATMPDDDYALEADFILSPSWTMTNGQAHYLMGRTGVSASDFLIVGYSYSTASWRITQRDSGTFSVLSETAATLTAGTTYRLRAEFVSNQVRMLVNDVEVIGWQTTTETTGTLGIRGDTDADDAVGASATASFDNFEVYTIE